jgi:ATP-dependent protease HslVU (ClpYQ) peptidase subunit
VNPELEQALRRILQQKDQIAAVDSQIHSRRTTLEAIAQDQQRLRENMKALKGSAEEKTLLQRYTRELNNQEDKLQDVRAEIARLELQREEKRQQLDASLEAITMDTEI